MLDYKNLDKEFIEYLRAEFPIFNKYEQLNWISSAWEMTPEEKEAAIKIIDFAESNYQGWVVDSENKRQEILKKELNIYAKQTNLTIKYDMNCPLCAVDIPEINAGIFFMSWDCDIVNDWLKNKNTNLEFSKEDIDKHRKHIITTPKTVVDQLDKIKKALKDVEMVGEISIDNIEILQSRINLLSTIIHSLENTGMTWTEQYLELNKILMQFIDLKHKITAGEKINVEIKYKSIDEILKPGGKEPMLRIKEIR